MGFEVQRREDNLNPIVDQRGRSPTISLHTFFPTYKKDVKEY